MKYRVLVIMEKREPVRCLPAIHEDFVEIYESKSVQDALFHLSMFFYHLVVLTGMPDVVRACKITEAVKQVKDAPVMVLMPGNIEDAAICMEAGADLMLPDTMPDGDVKLFSMALIRRYMRQQEGAVREQRTVIHEGSLSINYDYRKAYWEEQEVPLSRYEFEFLYLLAVTPGRVYTFGQIYQIVWGDDVHGDINNILNCTSHRIRRKLAAVSPQAGNLIRSVRNVGYCLENPEDAQTDSKQPDGKAAPVSTDTA